MINLIPPEGHKTMKREYIFRVGSTLCFLFSGVIIVLAISLIPTYVLINAQLQAHTLAPESDEKKDEIKSANAEVTRMRELLMQLSTTTQTAMPSDIIAEVTKYATPAITFKTFQVQAPKGTIDSIQVQGVAKTREALARFKNDLESSPLFEKADIPISDLAKDVDLPFVVTIKPTKVK